MSSKPLHVLIAGAGVAALEAALALKTLAEERVDIELVAPDVDFRYRPMSVAAPFGKGEARTFPLTRLVELAGARLTPGKLARVDLKARRAVTTDGAQLEWDLLLLAVGARMREGVPGSLTFRGEDDGRDLAETIDAAATGRVGSLTFALPTRAAWPLPLYELALMSKTELEDRGATDVSVDLVTPEAEPLGVFGKAASASMAELLQTRGISLSPLTTPVVFRNGALVVVPGRAMRTERVVSVPVPEGGRIPGIPQNGDGFVPTDEYGRVRGRDDVFAAGDMTTFPIKQGGIAAQQADCRGIDRGARRRLNHARAVPAGATRTPAHRAPSALSASEPSRFLLCARLRAALVAAGEDCRAVPGSVPGGAPRHHCRDPARGSSRRGAKSRGRARAR